VETLDPYRAEVAKAPACGGDFPELMRHSRGGDEAAARAITGGHLGMVLGLVESLPALPPGLTLLDTVEEANAALGEAVGTFAGTTADEFAAHVRGAVRAWLDTLDEREG
jgi:hypothetical protein